MQYLVLFLAIVVAGVGALFLVRTRPSKGSEPVDATPPLLGLAEPEPVLAPVLLPEHPRGADLDAVRLAPGLRGYRCDQVDAVLDAVGLELDRLQAEVDRLTPLVAIAEEGAIAVVAGAGHEPAEPATEGAIPGPEDDSRGGHAAL